MALFIWRQFRIFITNYCHKTQKWKKKWSKANNDLISLNTLMFPLYKDNKIIAAIVGIRNIIGSYLI